MTKIVGTQIELLGITLVQFLASGRRTCRAILASHVEARESCSELPKGGGRALAGRIARGHPVDREGERELPASVAGAVTSGPSDEGRGRTGEEGEGTGAGNEAEIDRPFLSTASGLRELREYGRVWPRRRATYYHRLGAVGVGAGACERCDICGVSLSLIASGRARPHIRIQYLLCIYSPRFLRGRARELVRDFQNERVHFEPVLIGVSDTRSFLRLTRDSYCTC